MSFDGGTTDETPTRTRFEPPTSRAARPFWEASREQRLVLQWCQSCDEPIHYPRDACPQCLGDERGQRHLGFDRVVFELPDQPDRQVDVELLDLVATHTRMLAY